MKKLYEIVSYDPPRVNVYTAGAGNTRGNLLNTLTAAEAQRVIDEQDRDIFITILEAAFSGVTDIGDTRYEIEVYIFSDCIVELCEEYYSGLIPAYPINLSLTRYTYQSQNPHNLAQIHANSEAAIEYYHELDYNLIHRPEQISTRNIKRALFAQKYL